jgi:predicted AlkP superfamily phosphohydrolase/phosphomutase
MGAWRSLVPAILLAALTAVAAADVPGRLGLASYFASREPGVQTGGVRMVPIRTPRGTFKV